jgi:UDP-glucose 4-epimerase
MVIPRFVAQALAGKPITVYGDGTQTRCFCHVADVVGALTKLIDHPSAVGEIFNLGSNEEVSILDLAKAVKRLTPSPSEIVFIPYAEAYEAGFEDMPRRVPDTTKVRELVGFRPSMSLDEIISSVVEFQRAGRQVVKRRRRTQEAQVV